MLFRQATTQTRSARAVPWRQAARGAWERVPSGAAVRAYVRGVNPIVGYRGIALLLALVIVSTRLHSASSMEADGWLIFLGAGHLALTAALGPRLRAAALRVNLLAIALDLSVCVFLVARGDGWRGPFWLYGVSAVFWPAYRYGVKAALLAVVAFDSGILLGDTDSVRRTFSNGFGGDLLARLTMVLIIAGAIAYTARALARVEELAAEAERNRIARDLHDGVGKTLGGISLEASSLPSWIARDPGEAQRRARYVARVSERAAIEVRDVIRSLRQQQATAPLLADARRTVDEWARRGREHAQLQINGPDLETPVLIRLETLRMLSELLDNVRRHAHAEHVRVRLTLSKLGVTIAVRDDGVGFDPRRLDPWADEGHFGLLGARERAWMLGGAFRLEAAPGAGTEVTIDLPLTPRDERAPGGR